MITHSQARPTAVPRSSWRAMKCLIADGLAVISLIRWTTEVPPGLWRAIKCVLAGGLVVITSIKLAAAIEERIEATAPIATGNARDFWMTATGLDPLGGVAPDRWQEWVYLIQEESTVIYQSGGWWEASGRYHPKLYVVSAQDALAQFDAVLARQIERCAADKQSDVICGAPFSTFQLGERRSLSQLNELLRAYQVRDAYLDARRCEAGKMLSYNPFDEEHRERYAMRAEWGTYWIDRYWYAHSQHQSCAYFEWLFLTCLALFLVWPCFIEASPVRWAIHWGLFPLLFLLPLYLGYGFGAVDGQERSGEVLYPELLRLLPKADFSPIDQSLLSRVPHVLRPLPLRLEEDLSTTKFAWSQALLTAQVGLAGPTCAAGLSLLQGLLVYLACRRVGLQKW